MNKRKYCGLALSLIIILISAWISLANAKISRAADWQLKAQAATRMESYLQQIRQYKQELGLEESPEDIHHSGVIGLPYTGITTTSGAIEAKRTAANPNMSALVVQLLREAGITSGDRVGAGFSGSFPGLNLAVLAACETMGVEIIYIPSVGSSTYGANWPELTFPEIAARLVEDGLLETRPVAYSYGGSKDCGLDMDQTLLSEISRRMEQVEISLLYEEDYQKNLSARRALYQDIDCFIGVGGNLTTSGLGERDLGCGLLSNLEWIIPDEGSGLVELYGSDGLPVIYLLNIKYLAADYGLPYDPESPEPIGQGPLYQQLAYPKIPGIVGVLLCCVVLWSSFRGKRKKDEMFS